MSPLTKLIRRVMFLPVKAAEDRELRAVEVENKAVQARFDGQLILKRIERSSDRLRRTYDKLLERT